MKLNWKVATLAAVLIGLTIGTFAQTSDSNAPSSLPGYLNYELGWNSVTSSWDRLRTGGSTDNSGTTPNTGIQKVQSFIYNGSAGNLVPMSSFGSSADGNTGANGASVGPSNFNGTNWDRQRGNFETLSGSLITLATTSANGTDQTNFNGKGVKCTYDVTAITGTGTVLTIQAKDSASGKYSTLLASASLSVPQTVVLTVYPGMTASANVTVNDVVPRVWRVITTNTALTVFTGTIGCSVLS